MECGGIVVLAAMFSMEPRTYEITVSATSAISQRVMRPEGELALFSGIGSTSHAIVAVLAIRPEGKLGRAVHMTRPVQCPQTEVTHRARRCIVPMRLLRQ